jgi:hypothetical protein
MKLELEVYGCLCETSLFRINDIEAEYSDFGSKYDHDSENAPNYCCGNMLFVTKSPKVSVLNKYNISVEEYYAIGNQLEDKLSFGSCGWCE